MKKPSFLFLLTMLMLAASAQAQTYVFDGNLDTDGIQNGSGPWSVDSAVPANRRWFKDDVYSAWDNSGLAIAEFGNTTSNAGGTLTLDGEIKLAGMKFNPLATSLGSIAHAFTGGTLNFGEGGLISISNAASGGSLGGQWVTFNSLLQGNNLTFQKADGTGTAFVRISAVNTDLTGVLTLNSATGVTGGIYASIGSPTYISNLSGIDVQAGSIFNPTGAGNYTTPVSVAGIGASNYGAIRVDRSDTIFSGAMTLTGNARFHTHINTANVTISGGIGESGSSWAYSRTATSPVNTILRLATHYTTASTYTGATIYGRGVNVLSTTDTAATEGGVNILDFTAATAPEKDLLYHDTAAGALLLHGGLATPTVLELIGSYGQDNGQRFSSVTVGQGATAIAATSGFSGRMDLDLRNITRTGNGALAIAAPATGNLTATAGGAADGLVGTWATYRNPLWATGGWAGLSDGILGVFSGDLVYEEGITASTMTGYTPASHLNVTPDSTGDVLFEAGVTDLATLSMSDSANARQLDLAGKTLRLGSEGGLQMIAGAQALTVGTSGDGSSLTAGGADNTAGQIMLTNMSGVAPLAIHSTITNNGTGAVSLSINGTGRTILAGANDFTGVVTIHSGVLEAAHDQALGATGSTGITKIMNGASLNLSGSITLGETIQANGHGIAFDGAIRNLDGINTITPAVRIQSSTRFTSDSGKMVLAGGLVSQISATSYTFSGNGDIELLGPITATSGLLNKDGPGTLTLTGTSSATGITTVHNGILKLNFDGPGAPAANILYTTATLSSTVGTLTLGGGTLQAVGKLDSPSSQALGTLNLISGSSRISAISTGTGSMDITFGSITRAVGTSLRFDLPASGSIRTTAGSNNALLTGTGEVAYATVGDNDWAATTAAVSSLRSIVGLSTLGGYTASGNNTLSGNADIALGITSTELQADTVISSLRFNQPQATTIGQDMTDRTLTTGGILVTPVVGANISTISAASLRAATGSTDLVIFQNNTAAPLVIQGNLINASNAAGTGVVTTSLTKTGPGTVILEYDRLYVTGDYTGATRIQNGTLQLVKTVSSSISYAIYAGTTFTLGSGTTSGKLILGSTSTGHAVTQYGGLRTEGSGTGNALVGGTPGLATFLHYVNGTLDFSKGFIGGSGENEDNLNLTLSLGTLQLGPANTYKGKTNMLQNTIEVSTLADRGLASSLGTGDSSSTTHIIDMATATTGSQNYNVVATLRYTGDTNSVTNRPVNVRNTDIPADVISVTAVLENIGTGTVKFTSPFTAEGGNTVDRLLRLSGTNQGVNEIVSFKDVNATIFGKVEKTGVGSWILTGASTYSGGTSVSEGTLLVTTQTGSGTGLGQVSVAPGAVFGGSGRIAPDADKSITLTGGTLQVGTELPGLASVTASSLTIQTTGTGRLDLLAGSSLTFDLFSGAGLGDNTAITTSADLAVILGAVTMDADTVLKVSNPTGMTGWAYNDQWRLFDWSGLTGPEVETVTQYDLPTLPSGLVWNTDDLFTTGILSIAFVPEPSRMLLLLAAFITFCSRRRRPGHELGQDPLHGQ